jgi:cytosine/uracil/thiamine/allantoin permease
VTFKWVGAAPVFSTFLDLLDGGMNAVNTSDIGYLFGPWSILALFVGSTCTIFRFSDSGRTKSLSLSWVMALFTVFLGLCVLPLSYAYSGPLSPADREVPRYGIYFGFLVAFTFGFAFAVDALLVRNTRRRALAAFTALLYSLCTWFLISTATSPKQ